VAITPRPRQVNPHYFDKETKMNKLGIYFTHQGSGLFEGDVEKVGVFRQLGYGFHTG
jgi:hypothetical protein